MAETLNPQEVERFRKQAFEYAMRSQRASSVSPHTYLNTDKLPQGNTVTPEINPPSTATSYEQFLREHPGEGTLKVQVTSSRSAFPVEGATVEVSLVLGDQRYILHRNSTDESGIVDNMRLPAYPADYSQKESTASGSGTTYNVSIFHPAFAARSDGTITIYDAIQTILPIVLQPTISPERGDF